MKRENEILEKVFAYIREHHMLQPGDRVIAGVSGGADSVCLLFVLLEWAKHSPLKISVVHVNHGIRPEAAQDAGYVEELCRTHGIPFFLEEVDVHALAAAGHLSEEEAGRQVRYETFARVGRQQGDYKVAVAHNLNDRSETMLFHLLRGSGLKGLCSIQPVRGEVIRPLLCLERREIVEYLKDRGIAWCEDATNAGDAYTRNRIRHHLLPWAEREIVSGAARHLAQTADQLSEVEEYLQQQTMEAWQRCVRTRPGEQGYEIGVEDYRTLHPALQKRLLLALVQSLSPGQKDISAVHIHQLQTLFVKEENRRYSLPFGITGRRSYGQVILERSTEPRGQHTESPEQGMEPGQQAVEISIPSAEESPEWHRVVEYAGYLWDFHIFVQKKKQEVPQNEYTKWFDCDKIKRSMLLRTRLGGDYLTIADGKGGIRHKSLQDYMVDCKIPREYRGKLPVLAEEDHILWLPEYRISEYYKISENTKRILQVQLVTKDRGMETEEKNGRTC